MESPYSTAHCSYSTAISVSHCTVQSMRYYIACFSDLQILLKGFSNDVFMMSAKFDFDFEDLEDEYDEPGRCTQTLSLQQARLVQDKKSAAEIRLARSRSRDPSRHRLQMPLPGFGADATRQVEAGDSVIGDLENEVSEKRWTGEEKKFLN